jgi:uncharacterized membrane protein
MKRGAKEIPLPVHQLVFSLFVSNLLSISLWLIRIIGSGVRRYDFMLWNLFLAWLPLVVSTALLQHVRRRGWLKWSSVGLTVLWLLLLPNSFYMVTDLVHLQSTGEVNVLFDTVLMMSFIFNGLVIGYLSLVQVHRELLKRLSLRRAHGTAALILLVVSFALYLGRSLRWNSWDVVLHPAGLLFDVSDRLIHPVSYPEAFLTTATFWLLFTTFYYVAWQIVRSGAHLLATPRSDTKDPNTT